MQLSALAPTPTAQQRFDRHVRDARAYAGDAITTLEDGGQPFEQLVELAGEAMSGAFNDAEAAAALLDQVAIGDQAETDVRRAVDQLARSFDALGDLAPGDPDVGPVIDHLQAAITLLDTPREPAASSPAKVHRTLT